MKVGLIGAGNIAGFHLAALRKLKGVEVAGILDVKPGAAEAMAQRLKIKNYFSDREEFFDQVKPDVVHVLTPPRTHHEIAVNALNRRIHVLTEKPMAMTTDECETMISAAANNGMTLGVNHNYLYDPRVQKALRLVQDGEIGEVVHVETLVGFDPKRLIHFQDKAKNNTHWVHQLPGGLLEDLLPHPLYLSLAFLDDEATLTHSFLNKKARLQALQSDELRLFFESKNATASITLSLSIQPDDFIVSIHGTRATIKIDLHNMLVQRIRFGKGPKAIARGMMVASSSFAALAQMGLNTGLLLLRQIGPPGDITPLVRAHYSSLLNQTAGPVPPASGKRVVEIIRTIWPV